MQEKLSEVRSSEFTSKYVEIILMIILNLLQI